ncbi:MAG: hypothetical protein EKK40_03285 [Bradyrhizobiaceae bacterium]|nr:MAG: hypothetical protein EKK40_03285 [Bradyrhizobiaceae bacterium]
MNESKPPASKPGAGKTGGLNAEIQARIGHQLRAMYDDVVKQGIPDRFADLLRQLDAPAASSESAAQGTAQKPGRD